MHKILLLHTQMTGYYQMAGHFRNKLPVYHIQTPVISLIIKIFQNGFQFYIQLGWIIPDMYHFIHSAPKKKLIAGL